MSTKMFYATSARYEYDTKHYTKYTPNALKFSEFDLTTSSLDHLEQHTLVHNVPLLSTDIPERSAWLTRLLH